MNSFLDATANQRSSLNAHKNCGDLKQLSPKLTQTPLAQQSNNTNHTKTQPNQTASNQTKNNNRRKNTYQSNGKKRNFSGSQNNAHNIGVSNNSADNRQYHRLGNNNSSNHNATVSGKKGDTFQIKDSFDSVRSTNANANENTNENTGTSLSRSSNNSESSSEGVNTKPNRGNWMTSSMYSMNWTIPHFNRSGSNEQLNCWYEIDFQRLQWFLNFDFFCFCFILFSTSFRSNFTRKHKSKIKIACHGHTIGTAIDTTSRGSVQSTAHVSFIAECQIYL